MVLLIKLQKLVLTFKSVDEPLGVKATESNIHVELFITRAEVNGNIPAHSGFPNTCLTTDSESEISVAQPKSIIFTFGNGPPSRRKFCG